MRIAFRFRWIAFVATLLLVVLGISLAHWQERRAAQKIALQATLNERATATPLAIGADLVATEPQLAARLEFRHVSISGQFVHDWPIYLDNRPYQGRAGFFVLMPFRIDDSATVVLVARGWLPRNMADRDRIQPYDTPAGRVTIEGIVRTGVGHVMQLGTATPIRAGAIVQNLDPPQFAQASKMNVLPFVVEQTGTAGDQMVRDWPAPALDVAKHQGYAFQWYALATMAFLYFVFTGFRRGTRQS